MEQYLQSFLDHKKELDEIERRGDESYGIEFMKLREFSQNIKGENQYSSSEGEKSINIPKNRYKDILPFDYCRVKLKKKISDDSDYINASFIKSTTNQSYIAAQGPMPTTVVEFWSMIWDYDVRVVVMACQEYEGIPPKLKCQRYWNISKDEELLIGPFSIKMIDEKPISETDDTIICRNLTVTDGKTHHNVTHLHYTKWPDKFIPKCIDSILCLINTMRNCHSIEKPQPLLVHCSAGCGRTGTILAIDYVKSLLDNGRITEKFNLFDIIIEMRKQRMAIVQTQEQYQYVHEAVAKLFEKKLELIEDHHYDNSWKPTNSETTDYEIPDIVNKKKGKYQQVFPPSTIKSTIVLLPAPLNATISSTNKTPPIGVEYRGAEDSPSHKSLGIYEEIDVNGSQKYPAAAKRNPVAARTTSLEPSKTFNDPGSHYSVIIRHDVNTKKDDLNDYQSYALIDAPLIPPKTIASQMALSNRPTSGDYFYKGINIGFPVRLKKPRGPRPFVRSL